MQATMAGGEAVSDRVRVSVAQQQPEHLCELVRMDDLEQLRRVRCALQTHGIDAHVADGSYGPWRQVRGFGPPRLMVRQRDLVYARWVAHAMGVDAWPDPSGAGDGPRP
jgi:hypothetical protein